MKSSQQPSHLGVRQVDSFVLGLEGAYELVVSPLLLDELERDLGYSTLGSQRAVGCDLANLLGSAISLI